MNHPITPHNEDGISRPALQIDFEFYARFLEETDATDDQKRELMETIWSIAVSFVEMGFGVHGVQQACEQKSDKRLSIGSDVIELLNSSSEKKVCEFAGGRDARQAGSEES